MGGRGTELDTNTIKPWDALKILNIVRYTIFSRKYTPNLLVLSWFFNFLSNNFTAFWYLTQWTIYFAASHPELWFAFIQESLQAQLSKQNRMTFLPGAHSLQRHLAEALAKTVQAMCNAAWYSGGKAENTFYAFSKTFIINIRTGQTLLMPHTSSCNSNEKLPVFAYTNVMCKFLCQRQKL